MIKYLLTLSVLVITSGSLALDKKIDLPLDEPRGLVIIAPAKKYLMQETLFQNLAKKLSENGYIAVRFNWSATTLEVPELELIRAAEDLNTVTKDAQRVFGFTKDKTVIISKSFSTKALAPSLELAKTHILLTPNCSAESPFEKMYHDILNELEISLSIVISNEDPNCDIHQIYQTLSRSTNLPTLFATHGDHNFVVIDSIRTQKDFKYQSQAIDFVVSQILLLISSLDNHH